VALARKIRLGDLLVDKGLITEEQLQLALSEQKKLGRKLGRTLIELGMLDENVMLNMLADQLKIPLIDINSFNYNDDTANRLPESFARRHRALVLEERPRDYLVGMADPTDIYALDEIQSKLDKPVSQAIVHESELLEQFDLVYRRTDEISALASELGQDLSQSATELSELLQAQMTDAPVAKLLQSIFEDAVQIGASDIHIEPDQRVIRIRQRIGHEGNSDCTGRCGASEADEWPEHFREAFTAGWPFPGQGEWSGYRRALVDHAGTVRRIGGHAPARSISRSAQSGSFGYAARFTVTFPQKFPPVQRHGAGNRTDR